MVSAGENNTDCSLYTKQTTAFGISMYDKSSIWKGKGFLFSSTSYVSETTKCNAMCTIKINKKNKKRND